MIELWTINQAMWLHWSLNDRLCFAAIRLQFQLLSHRLLLKCFMIITRIPIKRSKKKIQKHFVKKQQKNPNNIIRLKVISITLRHFGALQSLSWQMDDLVCILQSRLRSWVTIQSFHLFFSFNLSGWRFRSSCCSKINGWDCSKSRLLIREIVVDRPRSCLSRVRLHFEGFEAFITE